MAIFYHPPANIDDYDRRPQELADRLRQDWHNYITGAISDRDRGLFYDAATDQTSGAPSDPLPIPWNGFPRSIWQWFNADTDPDGLDRALTIAEILRPAMFFVSPDGSLGTTFPEKLGNNPMRQVVDGQLGDSVTIFYRQQDEYCEWHVDKNQGVITRISFTAEGPEYWRRMAKLDLSLVVDLYQEHVNPAVTEDELVWPFDVAIPNFATSEYTILFEKGDYNPYNRWNTRDGAMHLTHPSNTLGAEINLAADAAVLRPGVPLTPPASFPFRLVCCGIPAGVNRSSDPLISAGVNKLARGGEAVTLADPVGLYISSVDVDGLRDNQGSSVGAQCLSVPRASSDGSRKLRVVIEPPAGAGFTLDQCKLEGTFLTTGSQIARKITMVLFGQSKRIPGRVGESANCQGKCCSKPDAPNFRGFTNLGQSCEQLPTDFFDDEAPFEGATEPALIEVAAAEGVAVTIKELGFSSIAQAGEKLRATRMATTLRAGT